MRIASLLLATVLGLAACGGNGRRCWACSRWNCIQVASAASGRQVSLYRRWADVASSALPAMMASRTARA